MSAIAATIALGTNAASLKLGDRRLVSRPQLNAGDATEEIARAGGSGAASTNRRHDGT
jgi:hypothetical protein